MRKLLYIFIFLPFLVKAQDTPPIDTVHYLQKTNTMRTDTLATNLLTLNQSNNTAQPMSGATLKSYFQNGLVKTSSLGTLLSPNLLSKSANYTIVSNDFPSSNQHILILTMDCTGGSRIVTFPSASSFTGYMIVIAKIDSSVNTLTLSGVSVDNIIGSQNWSKEFWSNGTLWIQK